MLSCLDPTEGGFPGVAGTLHQQRPVSETPGFSPLPTCRPTAAATRRPSAPFRPAITLTDAALHHLRQVRHSSQEGDVVLRLGVKSGGCSGKS